MQKFWSLPGNSGMKKKEQEKTSQLSEEEVPLT